LRGKRRGQKNVGLQGNKTPSGEKREPRVYPARKGGHNLLGRPNKGWGRM